jgi:hypothetical protein
MVFISRHRWIDAVEAMARKLEANARKYPVDKARGSAAKYTEL